MNFASLARKERKIVIDFIYNIIASVVLTAILQIIVYPSLAMLFSAEVYGQMLTIIGIANIFVVSFGGGLNNARLIQNSLYEEKGFTGDFSLLLWISSCIGPIVFGILTFVFFKVKGVAFVLLLLYVSLGVINGYYSVAFRIVINYRANLIYNVIKGIGHIVGLVLAYTVQNWSITFLLGELFGLIYVLYVTSIYKEKIQLTSLFLKTFKIYLVLIGTNLISNIVNYLDRIFLYPILGGEEVSIYTVSSFVGKMVGLLVTPVAGVLLSYYAQRNFQMTVKKYWLINGITMIGGGVAGMVAIILAPWITQLLYPTIAEAARPYMILANAASMVGALSNILSPSVLKFANIFWQMVIQLVYVALYALLGYYFMIGYGLSGFCLASLLVNLVRMTMLLGIGHVSIRGKTNNVKR